MGVTAVAIVVVCAALYMVFELIERRKQRNFEEQLRQYIKEHKPIEFFTKMPLKDAAKVRSTVNAASFFE